MRMQTLTSVAAIACFGSALPLAAMAQAAGGSLTPAQARAIAKEAYVYGWADATARRRTACR